MHAYLIMAHKNLEQIKKLMKLLDYSENDIYISILMLKRMILLDFLIMLPAVLNQK